MERRSRPNRRRIGFKEKFMNIKHNILGIVVLSASLIFGAADCDMVVKSVEIEQGKMSIKGGFDLKKWGFEMQDWSDIAYSSSGIIAVVARGGIAKNAAKAIAAQFPAELKQEFGLLASLVSLIDRLNRKYTTPWYSTGFGNPNQMNIIDLVVLMVNLTTKDVVCAWGKNSQLKFANVVPQITMASTNVRDYPEMTSDKAVTIRSIPIKEGDVESVPFLCWEPKLKQRSDMRGEIVTHALTETDSD